jgi:hypothetical protein
MRRRHRLTTWIFLVVYLLAGLAPAQQLVVCLEPDGNVALEAVDAQGCTPCGEPEGLEALDEASSQCCPCTDIPLPAHEEEPQLKAKADSGTVVPLASPTGVLVIQVGGSEGSVLAPRGAPRARESLARIRTVVLRV